MYGIYLKWGENIKNDPKNPTKNEPLGLRTRGIIKTPLEWARLAQDAEKEERWGDAYHYRVAGSIAYTRNQEETKEMQLKSF